MGLECCDDKDFSHVNYLGIAIKQVTPRQRHVALLYCLDNSEARLCHLAWHLDLRDEVASAKKSYYWAQVGLDEGNAHIAAVFCSRLLNGGKSEIPYGLSYAGDCFDEHGRYLPLPTGKGLTCVTFVLAVMHHLGYELLNPTEWEGQLLSPEDLEWQEWVIDQMTQSGADKEHIDAMKNDVGAPRYRPEHVTVAAMAHQTDWPIDRATILARAESTVALVQPT